MLLPDELIKGQVSKLLAFDIIMGGHSESTFNVEEGGVLKMRTKMNRGRGFNAIFTFAL